MTDEFSQRSRANLLGRRTVVRGLLLTGAGLTITRILGDITGVYPTGLVPGTGTSAVPANQGTPVLFDNLPTQPVLNPGAIYIHPYLLEYANINANLGSFGNAQNTHPTYTLNLNITPNGTNQTKSMEVVIPKNGKVDIYVLNPQDPANSTKMGTLYGIPPGQSVNEFKRFMSEAATGTGMLMLDGMKIAGANQGPVFGNVAWLTAEAQTSSIRLAGDIDNQRSEQSTNAINIAYSNKPSELPVPGMPEKQRILMDLVRAGVDRPYDPYHRQLQNSGPGASPSP